MKVFKKINYIIYLLLIFLISSCAIKEFDVDDLIIVPEGYYISVDNNEEKNSELKAKWYAEDVAYLVYESDNRKNAKNILTIAEYQKRDYNAWLNIYFEDKTVSYNKEDISIACNFSSILSKNIQICQATGINNQTNNPYSIHKYVFGLADTIIVRVLCLESDPEFSSEHCRKLAIGLISMARELKLE